MSHSWQAPFRLLRDQFLASSQETLRVNLALTSFTHHNAYRDWHARTIENDLVFAALSSLNRAADHAAKGVALGNVWGEERGVRRFDTLAREAGNQLPPNFNPPTRLFPSFHALVNLHQDPVTWWAEFLFVTRRPSFTICENQPVHGCRIARLTGDPFLVSATAIERFMLAEDAPAIEEYFRLMRVACPWVLNHAGGLPTPMHPQGIITSPFHTVDPVAVFRCAVELDEALATRDALGETTATSTAEAQAEATQAIETATQRMRCVLNPRLWSARDWSRQLDLEDVSPDARQAIRTLGLALADIRGDAEWQERGRGLLSNGTCHLWSNLRPEERAEVQELLTETHRLWGWPANPDSEPANYTGPWATLSDTRVIDQNRWRTTRPEYQNHLHAMVSHPNVLVDTIRLPDGGYFDIYRDQVKGTRRSLPSICPQADPQPPEILRPDGDQLAEFEVRLRELGLIAADESLHLVGDQYRRETRCMCDLAPPALLEPRTSEWTTLRNLKSAIIGMTRTVRPSVQGRRVGLVVPSHDLNKFNALAVRVQEFAQWLNIPMPPVIPNTQLPHGPTGLPICEQPGGLSISEELGVVWLSLWSGLRGEIDAKLAKIDSLALRDVQNVADPLPNQPEGISKNNPSPQVMKPRWDGSARTLYFGERKLKRYGRHPATNQVEILAAFEKAGWPNTIPFPLPLEKLRDTIRDLNHSLGKTCPIRFYPNGTGLQIQWDDTTT